MITGMEVSGSTNARSVPGTHAPQQNEATRNDRYPISQRGAMQTQKESTGCAHDWGSVEDFAVAKVIESDDLGNGACCRDFLGISEGNVGVVARMQEQGWSPGLLEQIDAGEVRNLAVSDSLQPPFVGALRLGR